MPVTGEQLMKSEKLDERILAERLRAAGLRVTGPRLAVLTAVRGDGRHPDVTEIAEAARRRLGTLSVQAVYDNLDVLVEAGLVRRIQLSGQPARYEARVGDNHHHIVCRRCGATADIDCAVGAAPCLEPSADHGYVIEEAEVIFWGLCPRCQQEKPTEKPEDQRP
ncbi:MAG: Fur family transcriptional regulator [Capsulimonadales bacterium]|nr:Fur family transcriptional regulator [Capsulimonadales bacterium]